MVLTLAVLFSRFETALKRCALDFYTEETKNAKKRKEKLSKVQHLKLMVRASYKMAYFSELCNDFTGAVKHYSTAYTQLRDVKKNWKDFDEIKVVAEVLNFRLCYLHLERNTLSNATTQFHQHVNYYRSLIGDPDREYQHYAWVSRQYQIFGELLQLFSLMAPAPMGAPPRVRGWSHPAFYFQAAANYEMVRRTASQKLCVPHRTKETIGKYLTVVRPYRSSVMDFNKNTYVGQRVETGVLDIAKFNAERSETMTAVLEAVVNNSNEIAIAQELLVNHSNMIIRLLNVAQEVYKLDPVPNERTLWQLMSQVAQESFLVGDFEATKINNDFVIPHYRKERWWGLLTTCLKTNLQCAIHMKQWEEVAKLAADLLSPSCPATADERKYYAIILSRTVSAHRNNTIDLSDITPNLNVLTPAPSPSLSSSSNAVSAQAAPVSTAQVTPYKGNPTFISHPLIILQNSAHSHLAQPLLKCNVSFPQQSASIHDSVTLNVTLTSSFPSPMRFDMLRVLFTDSALNVDIKDSSGDQLAKLMSGVTELALGHHHVHSKQLHELQSQPHSLILLPNKPKIFSLQLSFTHVTKIQCSGVTLEWGTSPRCLQFHWDWTSRRGGSHYHSAATHRRFLEASTIDVLQLRPKLDFSIEHEQEALEGEYLPITLRVRNGEDRINGGTFRITPHLSNIAPSSPASPALAASPLPNGKNAPQLPSSPSSSSMALSSPLCPFISDSGSNGADIHEIPVQAIEPNTEYSAIAHFVAPKGSHEDEYSFKISFVYDTETYSTSAETMLCLPVRAPFETAFDVYDDQFREIPAAQYSLIVRKDGSGDPLRIPGAPAPPLAHSDSTNQIAVSAHKLSVGSNFYVRAELKALYDVEFQSIDLAAGQGDASYQNLSRMANKSFGAEPTSLKKGNKYSVWFSLKVLSAMSHTLGAVTVEWKRPGENSSASSYLAPAPSIYADSPAFTTKLRCDPTGVIGQPLNHEMVITNHTNGVLCVALEVEDAAGLAVAGDRKTQYRLNAFTDLRVKHVFVPLSVGAQRCPKFMIKQLERDGSGLGAGGALEPPFLTLHHSDIFVEPNVVPPFLV